MSDPRDVSLRFSGPSQWMRTHARLRPNGLALVDLGVDDGGPGGRRITFGELNERINRIANQLLAAGVTPGNRVSMLAGDSFRYLETVLACARIGVTYSPLNVRLVDAEVERLVQRAESKMLFVSTRHLATGHRVAANASNSLPIIDFDDPSYETWLAAGPSIDPGIDADPDSIISLAFTSGTTGTPKGVQQSQRMMANLVIGGVIDYGIGVDEFRYSASPLFHIAGIVFLLIGVALGIPSLVLPQFDPDTILTWMQGGELTGVFLVPTMISTLLELPRVRDSRYESIRSILYGAAPITPALLRRAMDTFGCDFVQLFGAGTEAGLQTVLTAADHRRAIAGHEHLLGSVGRPAFGVDFRIVDDDLNDVPIGAVGEIATRSNQVMSGYLDMPDETAEALRGGWFRAGDLGRFDQEGYVYLAGRRKDMIIRGGENIYPIEIEAVLMEHADVLDVAVVGKPDDHWGEVVHGFIIPRDGDAIGVDELREWCRARLAGHKVPVAFHFVDDLPRNAAGKVLKRELREQVLR